MSALPLHLVCLALTQLAPPADFPEPPNVVPIQNAEPTDAAARVGDPAPPVVGSPAQPVPPPQQSTFPNEAAAPGGAAPTARSPVAPAAAVSSLAPVSSADGVARAAMLIQESLGAADPAAFDGHAILSTIDTVDLTPYKKVRISWSQKTASLASEHVIWEQSSDYIHVEGAIIAYLRTCFEIQFSIIARRFDIRDIMAI